MQTVENIRRIRIDTLEKHTNRLIEDHVAEMQESGEGYEIATQIIWLGEIDLEPIKWKCPDCGRWNYQLQYVDPSGAMAVCAYCGNDNEF